MARLARVVVPGIAHHVTQRGNRRQQTFFGDQDYKAYLALLGEWCGKRDVAIWAYCLMPNHVQCDRHYLMVRRYIESNPLRAGLVSEAGQWPWSSYAIRRGRESVVPLDAGSVELPSNWGSLVHRDISQPDQDRLANSLRRGAPFGGPRWVQTTAARLNLESTLRPRGRPETCTEHVQLTGFDAPIHGPSKPVGSSGKR